MYCLYLEKKSNVVFWFSQKAGCTYVKGLYLRYLGIDVIWPHQLPQENLAETDLHYKAELQEPIHILFIRNPYKRIVSGFLDKLTWKPDFPDDKPAFNLNYKIDNEISFETFVHSLTERQIFYDPHFAPQLSNAYNPNIAFNKVFDIENIDRTYLDKVFGTQAQDPEYKGYFSLYKPYHEPKPAYKLSINEINQLDYKPDYQQFYSPAIKQKVSEIFTNDLRFFKNAGFDFDV